MYRNAQISLNPVEGGSFRDHLPSSAMRSDAVLNTLAVTMLPSDFTEVMDHIGEEGIFGALMPAFSL